MKVNSASPTHSLQREFDILNSSSGQLDGPQGYKQILLGGESPVTFEGVGFNKKRLQSLYLYHEFKGNKLVTGKFLKKADFMKIGRTHTNKDLLPQIHKS